MFKHRSFQKELIDEDQIPNEDLEINLVELHLVNKYLGGYANTCDALRKVDVHGKTIVDIGSGGGNMAIKINDWSEKNFQVMKVVGLDIKPYCINRSNRLVEATEVRFVVADYRDVFNAIPEAKIIHACLFFHHLPDADIIAFIELCRQKKATLIINDLVRNPFAYLGIKILTSLFSKSYLVKNDAPLSVLRGFKKSDWQKLILAANAKKYSIKNRWAFRHQVIIYG